jgi:hypothetical protein
MIRVWKYPVELDSVKDGQHEVMIDAPKGAKPLCVMKQAGTNYLWAEVDEDAPKVENEIELFVIGTGHGSVKPNTRHLGSVIDGAFVWHVYVWEDKR